MKIGDKLIVEYRDMLGEVVPGWCPNPLVGDLADLELHALDLLKLMKRLKESENITDLDESLVHLGIFLTSDLEMVKADVLVGVEKLRDHLDGL